MSTHLHCGGTSSWCKHVVCIGNNRTQGRCLSGRSNEYICPVCVGTVGLWRYLRSLCQSMAIAATITILGFAMCRSNTYTESGSPRTMSRRWYRSRHLYQCPIGLYFTLGLYPRNQEWMYFDFWFGHRVTLENTLLSLLPWFQSRQWFLCMESRWLWYWWTILTRQGASGLVPCYYGWM